MPLLFLLFVGSGCAALMYEVVWFQLLELVIGSSAVSLGVLLGTYMGGLCLGSVLLPRFISTRTHPFRIWAALEFGIGAFGADVIYGELLHYRRFPREIIHGSSPWIRALAKSLDPSKSAE